MDLELDNIDYVKYCTDGCDVEILFEHNNKPSGFVITIMGYYSDGVGDILKASGGSSAKIMAGLTKGWTGLKSNGVVVEFSKDMAEKIYKEKPFILKQLFLKANNLQNFMPASDEN